MSETTDKNVVVLPPPKLNEADQLMVIIDKIASTPELDDAMLDRIDRMFEMREKVLAKTARQFYNQAMALAQNEMNSVVANLHNPQTKSMYADLAALQEQCKPIWTKYGFSVSSSVYEAAKDNHIGVECRISHEEGHHEVFRNEWPLDGAGFKGNANKTPIQAMGSTIHYARRYSVLMAFDLSVKGQDRDGNSSAPTSLNASQIKTVRDALNTNNVSEETFVAKAQIERLEDLPQQRLAGALKAINSGMEG